MTTERDVLDALRRKYSPDVSNGQNQLMRYAIGEHVKSATGFDARREADMIVMHLWPGDAKGRDLRLIGHEVKVSRADWLSELKQPDKAMAFRPYMDEWYLVVASPTIVRLDELPAGWGLMVLTQNGGIRTARKAPRTKPQPMPRMMLASFLRAVARTHTAMERHTIIESDEVIRDAMGRDLRAEHVCRYCRGPITFYADGHWKHAEGRRRCVFPPESQYARYRHAILAAPE